MPPITSKPATTNANTTEPAAESEDSSEARVRSVVGDSIGAASDRSGVLTCAAVVAGLAATPAVVVGGDVVVIVVVGAV